MTERLLFERYHERVQGMKSEFTPLRVTCHLGDQVIHYAGLHLDAILSYAVVMEQTQGAMLASDSAYAEIPIPLKVLWRLPFNNVPLYASTDLGPDAPVVASVRYMHRRGLEPYMSGKSLRQDKGPYKDKRIPMPVTINPILSADCIGHRAEIGRLLAKVTSIGKKSNGAGRVLRWEISPIGLFDLTDKHGQARRPIPLDYFGRYNIATGQHIGFSPPYWHPTTRWLCYSTGEVVT